MTHSGDSDDVTRTHVLLGKGTVVGHYRIVDKIGAGGMGEVYLADDTKLSRQVALKFLPANLANDADVRARFTREAQAAAKLDHPNIVTIHEVSEFNGRPFFAMQYVDGKTLSHYCREETLQLQKLVSVMIQVSEGLAKAHLSGVTHRDIKAVNIILDSELRPRILDFGLASVQGGEMLTRAGSTLGTIAYMSPEQAQGVATDHRSDLFSLGIVLYELITGRTPFKRNNDAATLHAIVSEMPEPLARYKSEVPAELQRIVSKSLAKNPSERYQSAADLSSDLRAVERVLTGISRESSGRVETVRPSIAVLPFTNMSADPENEYFSDGLTEELLNVLAKNPELKVTGRTSSFAFKGKQEDLRGIGQKLGVQTLLEGSVRKSGNRVRITAQLVSVSDGFHLWSDTYDRVLDDIFAVQDDIAKAVSSAMHVTLVGVSGVKKDVNPESYALVLRAHQSSLLMTQESLKSASELYRKAIALDPNNARAWAGLGTVLGHQIAYGYSNLEDDFAEAKQSAEKAVSIDSSLAEAHAACAFIYGALELKFKEAGESFERAHALAPHDSRIASSIAIWEVVRGNPERGTRLARKAIDLDPLNPWAWRELGRTLAFTGKYQEARESLQRAMEMSPNIATAYFGLANISFLEGKVEQASQEIEKERGDGYRYCGQAMIFRALGKIEESDRALASLLDLGDAWAFQLAGVYAYRGENDKAFEWLERGYETRDSGIPLAAVAPWFENLRTDRRWKPFIAKIGLSA